MIQWFCASLWKKIPMVMKSQRKLQNLYEIKETTLYSAMARMEKRGLIAAYYGEETFGKRRTYYTLTQLGREYYQEKCKEWEITRKVIDQFMEEKNHASD